MEELLFDIEKEASEEMMPLLLEADPSRELVTAYLNEGTIFSARTKEQQIIGLLVLLGTGSSTAEIKNLAVQLDFRSRGVGSRLIKEALAYANEAGLSTVEIGTGNSSFEQTRLYQRHGFRFHRIIPNFFSAYPNPIYENGILCRDMLMMRRKL